jgi:hypothetical protein
VRTETHDDNNAKGGRWGGDGVVTERKRTRNAHHVAFDKIKPERHLLDSLVYAVDTLFGVREDNVGFLVVACEYALDTLISQMNGWMTWWETGKEGEKKVRNDYSASVLENEEHTA